MSFIFCCGGLVAMSPDLDLSDLTIAGFLDSATGRGAHRGTGDYAAIATVGRADINRYYVLDVWMRRAAPSDQIRALFDLHEKWNYWLVGIEANCFQELLLMPIEEERRRRRAAGAGRWQLAVEAVHHHKAKEMRIDVLEPMVSNGWLRLAVDLPAPVWQQFESYPCCAHDDALDAIEGAVSLLRRFEDGERNMARGPARATRHGLREF